jgi:hypothetical protein
VRRRAEPESTGIPLELYYGVAVVGGFWPDDAARNDSILNERRRWRAEVRAAGFTIAQIREMAETDAGYKGWLWQEDRRRRLMEEG